MRRADNRYTDGIGDGRAQAPVFTGVHRYTDAADVFPTLAWSNPGQGQWLYQYFEISIGVLVVLVKSMIRQGNSHTDAKIGIGVEVPHRW